MKDNNKAADAVIEALKPREPSSGVFFDVLSLKEALQRIQLIKGLHTVFITDSKGLIISGTGTLGQRDMEAIGGFVNSAFRNLRDLGEELMNGGVLELSATFPGGRLFCGFLSSEFTCIAVGDEQVNSEKVSLLMKGYCSAIISFLTA